MQNLQLRLRMAAESILENEALRSGLASQEAESALLNWGISCAERLTLETAELDDESAEAAIYPQMRTLRKLLIAIKNLVTQADASDQKQITLLKIFDLARIVYGAAWQAPKQVDDDLWLIFLVGSEVDLINGLRQMIESSANHQGEDHASYNP
jgi:hypothetical protein